MTKFIEYKRPGAQGCGPSIVWIPVDKITEISVEEDEYTHRYGIRVKVSGEEKQHIVSSGDANLEECVDGVHRILEYLLISDVTTIDMEDQL